MMAHGSVEYYPFGPQGPPAQYTHGALVGGILAGPGVASATAATVGGSAYITSTSEVAGAFTLEGMLTAGANPAAAQAVSGGVSGASALSQASVFSDVVSGKG